MLLRLKLIGFTGVADGEFILTPGVNLIVGDNGSGKSTLMTHCSPLPKPMMSLREATMITGEYGYKEGDWHHDGKILTFAHEYLLDKDSRRIIQCSLSVDGEDVLTNTTQTEFIDVFGELTGYTPDHLLANRVFYDKSSIAQVSPAERRRLLMNTSPDFKWFLTTHNSAKRIITKTTGELSQVRLLRNGVLTKIANIDEERGARIATQKKPLTVSERLKLIAEAIEAFQNEIVDTQAKTDGVRSFDELAKQRKAKLDELTERVRLSFFQDVDEADLPLLYIQNPAVADVELIEKLALDLRSKLTQLKNERDIYAKWIDADEEVIASRAETPQSSGMMSEDEIKKLDAFIENNSVFQEIIGTNIEARTATAIARLRDFSMAITRSGVLTKEFSDLLKVSSPEKLVGTLTAEVEVSEKAAATLLRTINLQDSARTGVPSDCTNTHCIFHNAKLNPVSEREYKSLTERIAGCKEGIQQFSALSKSEEGLKTVFEADILPQWTSAFNQFEENLFHIGLSWTEFRELMLRDNSTLNLVAAIDGFERLVNSMLSDMKRYEMLMRKRDEYYAVRKLINSGEARLREEQAQRVLQHQILIERVVSCEKNMLENVRKLYSHEWNMIKAKYDTKAELLQRIDAIERKITELRSEQIRLIQVEQERKTLVEQLATLDQSETSLSEKLEFADNLRVVTDPSGGKFMDKLVAKVRSAVNDTNTLLKVQFPKHTITVGFDVEAFRFPVTVNGVAVKDIDALSGSQKLITAALLAVTLAYPENPVYLDEVDNRLGDEEKLVFPALMAKLYSVMKLRQAFIISHTPDIGMVVQQKLGSVNTIFMKIAH